MTDLQIEAASRAIAASKRGGSPNAPEIDTVWRSYMGQAKAAIAAYLSAMPSEADAVDKLRLAWEATEAQHEAAHEAQDAYIAALLDVAPALLAIARASQEPTDD